MSYPDDCFDRYREDQLRTAIDFANTDTKECGWHAINFPSESSLMERGGSGKVTTGLCGACSVIENAKLEVLLLARQRAEARYSDYLDWCENEKHQPEYLDRREFEEAI